MLVFNVKRAPTADQHAGDAVEVAGRCEHQCCLPPLVARIDGCAGIEQHFARHIVPVSGSVQQRRVALVVCQVDVRAVLDEHNSRRRV
eukprot:2557189-Prymnesium_polylepis.1